MDDFFQQLNIMVTRFFWQSYCNVNHAIILSPSLYKLVLYIFENFIVNFSNQIRSESDQKSKNCEIFTHKFRVHTERH